MLHWIVFMALPVMAQVPDAEVISRPRPPARPAFEVASIKASVNCGGGTSPGGPSPGRLDLRCVSLRGLIRLAYNVVGEGLASRRVEVLGGPGWLDTDHYDLVAKAKGNPPIAQMIGPMLQTLIEERFSVKVHKEPREKPVYALTLEGRDSKLVPSKEGSCIPMDLNSGPIRARVAGQPKYCGNGEFRGDGARTIADWYGVTMLDFASRLLSPLVDRPVIDKTGLSGKYDIHLEFVRDSMLSGPASINGEYSPDSQSDGSGPSIFTAVRGQLGLRLLRDKSPLDVIVVDHAEKFTEN